MAYYNMILAEAVSQLLEEKELLTRNGRGGGEDPDARSQQRAELLLRLPVTFPGYV
jgi:hypothetical protein